MDQEIKARINGLFVGQLTPEELLVFNAACAEGLAYRSYEGASGFIGLPKVRFYEVAT